MITWETYNITGITIRDVKHGERLKKKNGKKIILGKGSKRITLSNSSTVENNSFQNDDGLNTYKYKDYQC